MCEFEKARRFRLSTRVSKKQIAQWDIKSCRVHYIMRSPFRIIRPRKKRKHEGSRFVGINCRFPNIHRNLLKRRTQCSILKRWRQKKKWFETAVETAVLKKCERSRQVIRFEATSAHQNFPRNKHIDELLKDVQFCGLANLRECACSYRCGNVSRCTRKYLSLHTLLLYVDAYVCVFVCKFLCVSAFMLIHACVYVWTFFSMRFFVTIILEATAPGTVSGESSLLLTGKRKEGKWNFIRRLFFS